jgi:hypothetical protein
MVLEGILSFDLSGACDLESLLCAGIGFHLWHNAIIKN